MDYEQQTINKNWLQSLYDPDSSILWILLEWICKNLEIMPPGITINLKIMCIYVFESTQAT